MKNSNPILRRSSDLLIEAKAIIPGLTQTFSKGPQVYGFTPDVPHYVKKSCGVYAYDVDDNCYIDYSMGLGSVILGHGNPIIIEEVYKAICDGNSHSLMHPIEIELSRKVLELCKWAEMVRFGKNGSDVTSGAVRLARAYTNKKYIAVANGYDNATKPYHGWHDWSAALDTMNAGIPEEIKRLTLTFEFNNPQSLIRLIDCYGDKIACIVMEGAKFTAPSKDFVDTVNQICSHDNICLIIDETINGLRLSPCGAHEKFSYKPDLVTFGKAFGNGFPISILVGKKKIMQLLDEILFTMTYGGETSGLVAANKLLDIYQKDNVFEKIIYNGNLLKTGLQDLVKKLNLEDNIQISGWDTRFRLYPSKSGTQIIDNKISSVLKKTLFKYGILCGGVHNIALLHNEKVIEQTIDGYKKALTEIYK